MYELPLTHSLTHRHSSSKAPDLSFIIRFSQSTGLFPSIYPIYKSCNFSCFKFLCTSQTMHHFLATLQQALKEISLIFDRKRLYLLFQWCLSCSRFCLVYFSFTPSPHWNCSVKSPVACTWISSTWHNPFTCFTCCTFFRNETWHILSAQNVLLN